MLEPSALHASTRALAGLGTALLLSACPGVPNDDKDNNNNPGGCTELEGPVTSDTTLGDDCYDVLADLVVSDATLTIEAGTTLHFAEDVWLSTDASGAITAVGTASEPIVFKGIVEIPGHWGGVAFKSNDPANQLHFVDIAHGGSQQWVYSHQIANVVVADTNARLSLQNATLRESGGFGLLVEAGAVLASSISNTFQDNTDAPVFIGGDQVGALDAASVYAGPAGHENGDLWVEVRAGTGAGRAVTHDSTWAGLGVPYRITQGDLIVESDLTILPGAVLTFDSDGWLRVTTSGSLSALGSASEPIVFTGAIQTQGYWGGIAFESNDPSNVLDHVEVSYGGGNQFIYGVEVANVVVARNKSVQLTLTNSWIHDSAADGVYVGETGRFSGFENNVFESNVDAPIRVSADATGMLDGGSEYYGAVGFENGDGFVAVVGGSSSGEIIETNQSWSALNVPYRITDDDVRVEAALTIEAGAILEFDSDLGLEIETNGSLAAEGTPSDWVVLTGAIETAGYWKGIFFQSNDPANSLEYVEVGYGGSSQWIYSDEVGNVVLSNDSVQLSIDGADIHSSDGAGIFRYSATDSLTTNDVSFWDNAGGNIVDHDA